MDHLAQGRYAEAADMVTQRLKAVEMAATEGTWDRAKFLELVPADSGSMASREEHKMVQAELAETKPTRATPFYESDSLPYGKGKGKYQWDTWVPRKEKPKGKNKDKKGKGKGKDKEGKSKE